MNSALLPVDSLVEKEKKLGFERVDTISTGTYVDSSTIIVVPTRGMIHYKVAAAWDNLICPMNQRRAKLYAVGDEVGIAYNGLIRRILSDERLSKYQYVLTLEDDNVPPPDAHVRLLESIAMGPFDVCAGIYFTKGDLNLPMAYGDPKEYLRSGEIDFRPRDIGAALRTGNIVEVNGVGMGCTLWRMELFRKFEPPWFVTLNDFIPNKGIACVTQDLFFCKRLRMAGRRIAVDLRVQVGHLNTETGVMY